MITNRVSASPTTPKSPQEGSFQSLAAPWVGFPSFFQKILNDSAEGVVMQIHNPLVGLFSPSDMPVSGILKGKCRDDFFVTLLMNKKNGDPFLFTVYEKKKEGHSLGFFHKRCSPLLEADPRFAVLESVVKKIDDLTEQMMQLFQVVQEKTHKMGALGEGVANLTKEMSAKFSEIQKRFSPSVAASKKPEMRAQEFMMTKEKWDAIEEILNGQHPQISFKGSSE